MASIILKSKREKSLLRRHPWIFSGAIHKLEGNPKPGETVEILSDKRLWIARGAFSPLSQIRARIWTFDEQEEIGPAFFHERIVRAIKNRQALPGENLPDSYRVIFGESDGVPGLVVDKYGEFLVCQFLFTGVEYWKDVIVEQLNALIPNRGIYDRSDTDARKKEGLPLKKGVIFGEEPPDLLTIHEGDIRFLVDLKNGQKTGFYLDQRDNRTITAEYVKEKEVLNCFSYTGGFGITALKYGARHVVNIDSSETALGIALQNCEINGLDSSKMENICGDAFEVLRKFRDEGRSFDCVILDPPKLAESRAQIERAARAYKDINLLGFKILRTGGILISFSCSGNLDESLFQKIVADAALDANREAVIIRRLHQAPDHPVSLNFPEAAYLKGVICKVVK
ncbi:class I SAM-dependent methyltransferase [Candidatus Sumerlaeota bacterium]|nr:class I SAM-dependent methyltransferase [Candidatus Sumerlaeota bacterium]